MRYKKLFALLLALALVCGSLSGCASERQTAPAEPTVPFTDSLGRTVDIPETLTRVAPSGTVASMFLATIAPEYMTTINATPSSSQYKYLDPRLIDLPTTGQMYGSKSTLNLESILTSGAQVVIDLGDKKCNMAADLDALQRQIGMPVIFIEADLPHMAEAYRTLGKILSGKEARGEELAAFVDETVSLAEENAAKIQDSERISVLYTSGSSGLNTNAKGSIQAQVLELMKDLKEKYDTSMIMITHDLGIVSEVCDKVAIIYAGEVVEYGSLEHIYRNPQHPYTNGLFGSLPDISKDVEFLSPIEGLMPDPAALPAGCKFNPRCKYACPLCAERAPVLTETEPGHFVRCLIYENALDVKEVVKYE